MAHDDHRPDGPDVPSELPDGVTVGDLPDEEIESRARFVAALFDGMTSMLRDFVARGCPADEHELLLRMLTNGLQLYVSTFRGAVEWRGRCEETMVQRVVEWRASVAGGSQIVPPLLGAALLCDVAFGAQDEFWDVVREIPLLRDLEARVGAGPDSSRLN